MSSIDQFYRSIYRQKQLSKRCSVKKVFRIHKKTPVPKSKACNFIKKETLAKVFSCEFCEISKTIFFHKTPLVAASDRLVVQASSAAMSSSEYQEVWHLWFKFISTWTTCVFFYSGKEVKIKHASTDFCVQCVHLYLGYLYFPAPGPGPQFAFIGSDPQFVFTGPGPQFIFNGPGLKFVFTGPGPRFLFTSLGQSGAWASIYQPCLPNLYLLLLANDFYHRALNLYLPSYL